MAQGPQPPDRNTCTSQQVQLHLAGELQLGRLGGCYQEGAVVRHFVQTRPPPTAGTNQ